jgi:hypothetical protein
MDFVVRSTRGHASLQGQRYRMWFVAAETGVFPPPLRVGESHLSRALLRWQKKLILKKAFLIRESLDGNADLDFPRSSRPA